MPADDLRSIPLFESLTGEQLADVTKRFVDVEVDLGTVLARRGDFAYHFFVVRSGLAAVAVDERTGDGNPLLAVAGKRRKGRLERQVHDLVGRKQRAGRVLSGGGHAEGGQPKGEDCDQLPHGVDLSMLCGIIWPPMISSQVSVPP